MPLNATIGGGSSRGFGRNLGGGPVLFAFTTFTFTNAGAEGTNGPTQAQCQTAYAGQSWLSTYFSVPAQGFQYWTVPKTGTYRITAAGAQGGAATTSPSYYGGRGAIMRADFNLISGDVLIMVVGQRGGYGNSGNGSGGGGGSFVALNNKNTLLLAAGGGSGGHGNSGAKNGLDGLTTNNGGPNSSGDAGGTGGAGGAVYSSGGGPGGGYSTDGGLDAADSAEGGRAFLNSAQGGRGGQCPASIADSATNFNGLGCDQGGFGGGGGGEWCVSGCTGAGGGYSGGAGQSSSSSVSGAGGSYTSSTTNLATSDGFYNGSSSGVTNLGAYNGTTTLGYRANLHGYITVTAL